MDAELLQDVLSCPTLPSLPAVAVRVLELTSNPDVRMDELARTIQADQALSAKILRTVNSSFYGLRKRCTSIDKALVLLGLAPVKGLVLGFSLVSSVGREGGENFDYVDYWRRALNCAVGGKLIADACGIGCADEAFLVGLFQDIGMVALFRAMGKRYTSVVAAAGSDHAALARAELSEFELHHADVGSLLAESWKLPPDLVIPVRYHERPTACPSEHSRVARCVALANLFHAVLIAEDPTDALRDAYKRGEQWLNLDGERVDRLIREIGQAARELATLFELSSANIPNADEVLAKADRQMIEMARTNQLESYAIRELSGVLAGDDGHDPLTGVLARSGFAQGVRRAFAEATSGKIELTVAQFALDGLDRVAGEHGQAAQDEVVLGLSVMLLKRFEPMGGIVARVTDTDFGVILPGVSRRAAVEAAQSVCQDLAGSVRGWLPDHAGVDGLVRVSAGVAAIDEDSRGAFGAPETLIEATSRSVQAARGAGGACVRSFVPRSKAA